MNPYFFAVTLGFFIAFIVPFVFIVAKKGKNKILAIIMGGLFLISASIWGGYTWGEHDQKSKASLTPIMTDTMNAQTEIPTHLTTSPGNTLTFIETPIHEALSLPLAALNWDTFDSKCINSSLWTAKGTTVSGNCLEGIPDVKQINGQLQGSFKNNLQFSNEQDILEAYDYTNNKISALEAIVSIQDITGSAGDFGEIGIGLQDKSDSLRFSLRAKIKPDGSINYSFVRKIPGGSDQEFSPVESLSKGENIYISILKSDGKFYTYENGYQVGDPVIFNGPIYNFWIYFLESPGALFIGNFDEVRHAWEY